MAVYSTFAAPIIDFNFSQTLNQGWTYSATFKADTPPSGQITFTVDGVNLPVFVVDSWQNDFSGTVSISGTDAVTEKLKKQITPTIDTSTLTTVGAILADIANLAGIDITPGAFASVECYGPGTSETTGAALLSRLNSAFALCWRVSNGNTLECFRYTTSGTAKIVDHVLSVTETLDRDNYASKMFFQKATTSNKATSTTLSFYNGQSESTTRQRLINPNAGTSGFPNDVYIDPFSLSLVNIEVPINIAVWDKAVAYDNNKRYCLFTGMTDGDADPGWFIELYDDDPGTVTTPNLQAHIVATIPRVGRGVALGEGVEANYVRIVRHISAGGVDYDDFPRYDGVKATLLLYDEDPTISENSDFDTSFGVDGYADYNIVSESLWKDESSLTSFFPELLSFNNINYRTRSLTAYYEGDNKNLKLGDYYYFDEVHYMLNSISADMRAHTLSIVGGQL